MIKRIPIKPRRNMAAWAFVLIASAMVIGYIVAA